MRVPESSLGVVLALLACLVRTDAFAAPTASISSQVTLDSGVIRGSPPDVQGVRAFKAIPYAAPPVGPLRWHSPQSPPAWSGVRDATAFGAICWGAPVPRLGEQNEDCLSANVWTGASTVQERRPVMVWIHGGGFQEGSSAEPDLDGSRLAAQGVVMVSFNYRLGVFGFLAHPALDAEGAPSGDFGLQDQIAALKWVRTHISLFGGDPDNVTIFGESAGSNSVEFLMTSPLATGLFQRAIGESGAFWGSYHGSIATRAEAHSRGVALANRLGHGSIAELRAIPAEALNRETAWDLKADAVIAAFSPNIDGFVLADDPPNVFARRRQNDVPLLAGWNDGEGYTFFRWALPHASAAEFRAAAAPQFGAKDFLKLYPADTDEAARNSAEALIGDVEIREPTWEWLQLQRRFGTAPVYGYQFHYQSSYTPVAAHTTDIAFVFGTLTPQKFAPGGALPGPADRQLSALMMSYWVNFARGGDPNGPALPHWPAYQLKNSQMMGFDTMTAAEPEIGTDRFRFIRSFRKEGRFPESWRRAPPN
jgi:para-nitrobenzyl esterase